VNLIQITWIFGMMQRRHDAPELCTLYNAFETLGTNLLVVPSNQWQMYRNDHAGMALSVSVFKILTNIFSVMTYFLAILGHSGFWQQKWRSGYFS
jgi:hypothetical protein